MVLNLEPLGNFSSCRILYPRYIHRMNTFLIKLVWYGLDIESALWLLMGWCSSTRASAITALTKTLRVNILIMLMLRKIINGWIIPWDPIHLQFSIIIKNLMVISLYCHPYCNALITAKFHRCHNTCAASVFTKKCCDYIGGKGRKMESVFH